MLELNIDVMKLMVQKLVESSKAKKRNVRLLANEDVVEEIRKRCSEHQFSKKNIVSILHRASILSNQVMAVLGYSRLTTWFLWRRLTDIVIAKRHDQLPE